ncbi:vacuolar protein sorting-associated protein 70 [[Candida] anglica]
MRLGSDQYSDKEFDEIEHFLDKSTNDNVEVRSTKTKKRFLNLWVWIGTFVLLYFGYFTLKKCHYSHFFNVVAGDEDLLELAENKVKFAPFFNALETNLAGNWSKKYTAEPHLAGTNYGLVEWTRAKFEEYGFETSIDTYDIYVSYPVAQDLKLVKAGTDKVLYQAPLKEDEIKEDETSVGDDLIPTFLGYSANGNVTAEYVYVNYASKEDFEHLESLGVSVEGKIVIARYGKVYRGLKVKFAQDHGAVGVLLYSDPGDDYGITPANGYKQYPEGPARQESSVQRGSLLFLGGVGAAPGDPTTPGYGSKPGVERKDPHNTIPRIPALAISYREVKPILAKLNGHGAQSKDKGWKGELEGFDYSIGPNANVTLNLFNEQNFTITPLWNVYGEIKGEIEDEVIIIGNHRDAWIKGGAGDPNSGSATLLEVARAFGALKASGYVFKRTIILASWDGEEYGLLGSTEFGEYAAKTLQKNVVAYFNLDVATTGKNLDLGSSPVLNKVLKKALKQVKYPGSKKGESLYEHYLERHDGSDRIGNLGSGSDYTVFLEHLGIPSVDLGFGGGKGDPIYHYHSNYDSYHWVSKFGDPGFIYHAATAKFLGLAVLELSEHQLIDFKLQDYSHDLSLYYNETLELIPKKWLYKTIDKESIWEDYLNNDGEQVDYMNKITQGYYSRREFFPFPEYLEKSGCMHHGGMIMVNPSKHKEATLHDLLDTTFNDISQLHNVSSLFDAETILLQERYNKRDSLHWWQRIRLFFQIKGHNKVVQYYERNFLVHKGLHERSWFKHIVFASGRFTGYAGQTLPGLKEAAEDEDFERFVHWLGIVSKAIRRVTANLSV